MTANTPPPATGCDSGEAASCQWRSHSWPEGNEPCDCEARFDAVTTHTRTPHEQGPDYCNECSTAISEWVTWERCETRRTQPPAPQAGASVGAPEPPGLGAVVTDIRGKRWVRDANYRDRWYCPADGTRADWADLVDTVVQVESIGVRDA